MMTTHAHRKPYSGTELRTIIYKRTNASRWTGPTWSGEKTDGRARVHLLSELEELRRRSKCSQQF